jgi:UDPglucose 6-dehydrogenase
MEKARQIFKEKVIYCNSPEDALKNCEALVIITEWDCFKKIKPEEMKKLMKSNKIFDGRNIFDPEKMKKLGFNYYSIGRK